MIPVFEVTQAPGACPANAVTAINDAIVAVDRAWDRTDEAGFAAARTALVTAIGCLEEVPAQNQVARIHQAMALVSFVGGEMGPARRSMLTARKLEPGWKLLDTRFPPAHPYVDLYRKATHPGELGELPPIAPEVWIVDGIMTSRAPEERAFLLQVARDGEIAWSGYLWDLTDVPNRSPIPPDWRDAPHPLQLGALVSGGARFSSQTVVDGPLGAAAWTPESGTTPAAGLDVLARWTPTTIVGGELAASVLGPSDPIDGGGTAPAVRAVVRVGGAGWVDDLQPFAAARLGVGFRTMRAWTAAEGTRTWTLPSGIAGVEAGLRSDRQRLVATFDTDLGGDAASGFTFAGWRARVDGGVRIRGPLAVEGLLGVGHDGLPFVDADATEVGRRSDLDLRIGAGVAVWY